MYCSTCGNVVAHSLIYCNYCGAKLKGTKIEHDKTSEISPNILVCAMVFTFIFGIAAVFALSKATNDGTITPVLALTFLVMLSLEGVFLWLLLRRLKAVKRTSEINLLNEKPATELYSAPARILTEPVPSVIEQTTNPLEPVYREQKTKRQ